MPIMGGINHAKPDILICSDSDRDNDKELLQEIRSSFSQASRLTKIHQSIDNDWGISCFYVSKSK